MSTKTGTDYGIYTKAIHAGQEPDPLTLAVSPPIYQTSTFAFNNTRHGADCFRGESDGYIYTRLGNPTTRMLEDNVAALEKGVGGLATATGMAATCSVYFALFKAGDHVVGTDALYGPSRMVVERDWSRFGIGFSFVDTSDLDNVRKAMRPETRMLYIESPANPTIKLTDLAGCAAIAHENGAILVVDNTFMSPHLQNPFDFGADIIIHSMTKFLNGHGDVVAGMIVFRDKELLAEVRPAFEFLGGTMDPHQAWLVLRGIKTLGLRIDRAQENAVNIAGMLEAHPKVERVYYPGLRSHPQYELARKQQRGPGCLISFELKGGLEAGSRFLDSVRLCTLAVSLGGVETLIQLPAGMTHATIPREKRLAAGIADGLVRVSVGCEDVEDLMADLEQALEQC
ncbi:MAG: PLP-dependent transferase [Candidatus Eisenbacteria sp.]|nr:PLP-dependent transferase [Candidatus Eisenbacteria bacterium]